MSQNFSLSERSRMTPAKLCKRFIRKKITYLLIKFTITPEYEDENWPYNLNKLYMLKCQNLFVCVEVLQPSQPNGVMLSAVSLPNHTFTEQA